MSCSVQVTGNSLDIICLLAKVIIDEIKVYSQQPVITIPVFQQKCFCPVNCHTSLSLTLGYSVQVFQSCQYNACGFFSGVYLLLRLVYILINSPNYYSLHTLHVHKLTVRLSTYTAPPPHDQSFYYIKNSIVMLDIVYIYVLL